MRSVSVMLGAMALTVTPDGPSSWASFFVKAMIPPLAAAYALLLDPLSPRPAGRDVHDLAAPLTLHHRRHRVAEEECPVEVEGEEALPLGERQLVDGGGGAGDDGAPAHRVDQDVDAPVFADDARDHVAHLGGIEGVGAPPMRARAGGAERGHRRVQPRLIGVHAHDHAALTADDLRRRAADAACRRRDQRHLVPESHGSPHLLTRDSSMVLGQFASPYLLGPRLAASPLGSKGHVTRSPATLNVARSRSP